MTVNLRRALAPFTGEEYALGANALVESHPKLHFLLLGYVLMPDPWHALIWPVFPLTISRSVQDIKWISASALNRSRGASGSVWQNQFRDRFVRHAREFHQRLDYVHWNPIRKGLVKGPEDWRWSSYSNFAVDRQTVAARPVEIDYVRLPEGYRG